MRNVAPSSTSPATTYHRTSTAPGTADDEELPPDVEKVTGQDGKSHYTKTVYCSNGAVKRYKCDRFGSIIKKGKKPGWGVPEESNLTTDEYNSLSARERKALHELYAKDEAEIVEPPTAMSAAITLAVEEEYNEILQLQKDYEEDLQNMSAGYRPSDDTAIEDLGIDESNADIHQACVFAPQLPTFSPDEHIHRQKITVSSLPFNACIARPVSKKEFDDPTKVDKLTKAMKGEWDNLWGADVWDPSVVYEWSDVARWARNKGEEVHMGRLFGIMVEKGFELPENDPRRKFKYRVVFQGNWVIDQDWQDAIFQNLGSAPASMDAGKAVDAVGCFPGNSCQQADAKQAYVQAKLQGTETWVALPEEAWPQAWKDKGYIRPVVRLVRALYGHPDSGTFWEKHCDKELKKVGFDAIDNWPSCYWHDKYKLMLTVYVDDFKLAGPAEHLKKGWELIQQRINIDEPDEANLFLGCIHSRETKIIDERKVTVHKWDMRHYLAQICTDYVAVCEQATGRKVCLRQVKTPFMTEDPMTSRVSIPLSPGENAVTCPYCRHTFPESIITGDPEHPDYGMIPLEADHVTSVGTDPSWPANAAAAKKSQRKPTMSAKDQVPVDAMEATDNGVDLTEWRKENKKKLKDPIASDKEEFDDGPRGHLQPVAASFLMRILYAARVARWDLQCPVRKLAVRLTTWSRRCDAQLNHLICAIWSSLDHYMFGWVGNEVSELEPHFYADADFAGCQRSQRSSTGAFVALEGSHTRFPLASTSQRQTNLSDSTPMAEAKALHTTLTSKIMPYEDLWDHIFQHSYMSRIHEDNQALIRVAWTGKNPTMRHLHRCARISVGMLNEYLGPDQRKRQMVYEESLRMAADVFTKAFTDATKWDHALRLINHFETETFEEVYRYFEKMWTLPRRIVGEKKDIPVISAATITGCPRIYDTSTSTTIAKGLSLFGGTGHLAYAMAQANIRCELWDYIDGEDANMLLQKVHNKILQKVKTEADVVTIDFPCNTFSRARKNDGFGYRPSEMTMCSLKEDLVSRLKIYKK